MSLFLRIIQHLLPRGEAWKLVVEKWLTRFFSGLATFFTEPREFIDLVWGDLWPSSTRDLPTWEQQFGLQAGALSTEQRRVVIDAAWSAQGGQDPRYLQDTVQAAGFDIYIHEWWASGPPYVARDPNDHLSVPTFGSVTCGNPTSTCGSGATANAEITSALEYLVNKDLTNRAPPPLPTDPNRFPYFLYWGAESFPDRALVPAHRKDELERLLLKLCPMQHWIGLLIDYVDTLTTEDGEELLTEDGEELAA